MERINLRSSSPFFRPEQFETEMLNGREVLVLKMSKEMYLSESIMISLYSRELDAIPYEKSDTERKYLCVTNSFYIVVERGEKGFETSLHYFSADIKIKGDEITVNIVPIDDAEFTKAINDVFAENEFSGADCFNEKNMNRIGSYKSLEHLKMMESTDFIQLPYNGNQRKLEATICGDGELFLCHNCDFYFLDTGKQVCGKAEIGTLLYRRDKNVRNMVDIVKLQSYAHDFDGNFWAVVETVYSYPEDAEKIKAAYPEFYEKECASDIIVEKQELLDNAKELPYIREEYKIGDGILHVPVETTAAEISIPIGELHFAVGRAGYGHLTLSGRGRLRLNKLPLLCSLVEINRRFKLLYYKTECFVKCGDKYYAELRFERQSNFLDSLDPDLLSLKDLSYDKRAMDKSSLACAGYLMFRDVIKPVIIDKEEVGSNITEE